MLRLRQVKVQTSRSKSVILACETGGCLRAVYQGRFASRAKLISYKINAYLFDFNQISTNLSDLIVFYYRPLAPVTLPHLAFQLPMAASMQ